jgi:hypothetical protein
MSTVPDSGGSTGKPEAKPVSTQAKTDSRAKWPDWAKQLPRLQFDAAPNPNYQLIDQQKLNDLLATVDADVGKRIKDDIAFLDQELLRLFRERDYAASYQQNRYRLGQILFMVLAAVATIIGGLQGLSLSGKPDAMPAFAFAETIVALLTVYMATINGRVPALPLWLQNRRRAENLRREYYRYLMRIAPYDNDAVKDYERKLLLSTRAANINRGIFPDQPNDDSQ